MAWAPDYVTTAELREYVTRSAVTADDAQLALAISTASRAIDRHCNRQFGLVATPEARYYTARFDQELRRWVVEFDDLMTTVGLVVMADLDDSGDYASPVDEFSLRPINAQPNSKPWTKLVVHPTSTNLPNGCDGAVEVTARFGWTTVPTPIKQACLLQASRLFMRREAPFGIAGSPDAGSEMRLLAKLDPDVSTSVGPFIRWWGAA